jgi:hypothetical protein
MTMWRGIEMELRRVSAVIVMAVLAVAALSVPLAAERDGGGAKSGDTLVLYLSGTPREMGMQYGQFARDAIVDNVDQVWDWATSEGLDRDEMVATALAFEQHMSGDMIDELEGMAETSGVPYEDLLVLNVYNDGGSEQRACTNFAAAGSGVVGGLALSSKNRDLNNIQVLLIVEPSKGSKFFGMMSAGALGIAQGINEKGLAIGHTWMPVPEYDETGYAPFIVNQMVMESCVDVYDAISFIDDVPKREGATFGISDASVAAFVESIPTMYAAVYGNDIAVDIVEDGVRVHTNHYVLDPFFNAVVEDGFGYMWTPSYARYDRGLELLAENPVVDVDLIQAFCRDLENWGVGSPDEVTDAHPEIPDECWAGGWPGFSICNARTVSSSVFTADAEYPEHLSVMWMAINNPAWAPYVPIHNGLLLMPEETGEALESYVSGRAWSLSAQLRSTGEWGELIPVLESWEDGWQAENAATEDAVRALLDKGRVSKAVSVLTAADCGIASDALVLLESLLDATAATELVAATVKA